MTFTPTYLSMADFDWPTRVTLTWYPVHGNLLCARSTTRGIQLNSDDRDHGDANTFKKSNQFSV